MPRTRLTHRLPNLLLALALAVGLSWAIRGPSALQRPQDRLIGRWLIVAHASAAPGEPIPDFGKPDPEASPGPLGEVLEFFADGSMRRYPDNPNDAHATRGRYALHESGEFTMELSRLTDRTRTIHFSGSVRFEQDMVWIRGRLTDATTSVDANIAYLLRLAR